MRIVVDANPLISLLIKPGKSIDILLSEDIELVAPALLVEELYRHKDMILQKSQLSREDIEAFLNIIRQKVRIIAEIEFIADRTRAEDVCPDEKDIPYFALALSLSCGIWSNEKILKEQTEVDVYATHELISMMNKNASPWKSL